MFLHILGHIKTDKIFFIVKKKLSQGLSQFGFADSSGSQENKNALGTVNAAQSRSRTSYRPAYGRNGIILTDYPPVQFLFYVKQFLCFGFFYALQWYAGIL